MKLYFLALACHIIVVMERPHQCQLHLERKYFHDVLRLPKVVNFRGGAIKAATDRGIVFDSYTYGYQTMNLL